MTKIMDMVVMTILMLLMMMATVKASMRKMEVEVVWDDSAIPDEQTERKKKKETNSTNDYR